MMCFFVLLGIIGFVGYRQTCRIADLQAETNRLNQEKVKYQALITQIEKLKKDQALIETKLGVIKGLKNASQLPARVLDEIANLTPPDRMWLLSLDYTGSTMILSGTALDNATIAEYMNKVGKADFFTGAELKNSSLVKVGDQKLKSFSMTVNVWSVASSPSTTAAPAVKK